MIHPDHARENIGLSVGLPRVEQVPDGQVLGIAAPRLSWHIEGGRDDTAQAEYEIEFTPDDDAARHAVVHEADSVLIPWPFEPLRSRDTGRLRVRVASSAGDWSAWSQEATVTAGLLNGDDWVGEFVSPKTLGGLDDGAPFLFTEFELDALPRRATLYISARGIHVPELNGIRIGDDVLAPGWTEYAHRLRYQSYDALNALVIGRNTLGSLLGNGWYRGQLAWEGNRQSYGDRLSLLAQLELDFADGTRRTIATDNSWTATRSQILSDDLYDGEARDLAIPLPVHDDSPDPVVVVSRGETELVARRGPAVRVTERVAPISVTVSPSGRTLVDFGQNLVGWVELTVRGGTLGDEVIVRHAEVLEHGELSLRPLRTAKATCRYVLAGADAEILKPTLTFSGFRFVDIMMPSALELLSITSLVVGTDLERIGWFDCSDSQLNRLHENVIWSARGNFLDLPTDCPQRDERLGWTGDIQVFAPTANFLFDTAGFLAGWLEDLTVAQTPDGGVPFVIPDVLRYDDTTATGWGDAAVVVPWSLYTAFGDEQVLRRQYRSMRAWVQKLTSLADDDSVWNASGQFGDWLDPSAPPEDASAAKADQAVVATAHYARSTRLLARAARVIGEFADATEFEDLADRIAAGFQRRFVTAGGRVYSDCQTVYALALAWDLIDDDSARSGAGARLVELVEEAGYRVATGFLGTPVILDALSVVGRPDVAYRMLQQTEVPSWLYPVTMGATTIWERWDSLLPDGSVNPGSMTSFNHYAYGAVADWMHRAIGGLAPIEPAYREFRVKPLVADGLDHASVRHLSPYGEIAVQWRREHGSVRLDVEVPSGTTAEVWVPGAASPERADAGTHSFTGSVPTWA